MTTKDQPPVPVDLAQWPEGRSFVRLYHNDPVGQSRLAMAIIGFRESERMRHGDPELIEAADVLLKGFRNRHPEFMEDGIETDEESWGEGKIYHMDERLNSFMPE